MWRWFSQFAEPCGVYVLTTDDDVTRDVTCDCFVTVVCMTTVWIQVSPDKIENQSSRQDHRQVLSGTFCILWVFFHATSAWYVQKDVSRINLTKLKTDYLMHEQQKILISLFTLKTLYFIWQLIIKLWWLVMRTRILFSFLLSLSGQGRWLKGSRLVR